MRSLVRRLLYLLDIRRHQADLEEEMALHREMLVRQGAGAKAFGNATLAREDARGVWLAPWLESIWQDVTYAARSLRRQPAFATCAIVIVALGTGGVTGVVSLLDPLVVRSLPVDRPERLVWFQSPAFTHDIFKEVQARLPIFDGFFGWNLDRAYVDWTGQGGQPLPCDVLEATPELFRTLGVNAVVGRTFERSDTAVAVLSHRAWTRQFGADPRVMGRTIRIATRAYAIVGVAPRDFFGVAPGLHPDVFVPIHEAQPASVFGPTTASWLHLMGRLKDGLSREQADAILQATWPAVLEATTMETTPERRALFLGRRTALESGRTGFSRVRNRFGEPLRLLMALVVLLLAVACASVGNLLLARGVARRRELAVRVAIGASQGRLLRQLATEALLITLAGATFGLLVAWWSAAAIVSELGASGDAITIEASPGWRTAAFAMALAVIVSFAAGWLPALAATRRGQAEALRENWPDAAVLRRWSIGKLLVAVQVALGLVLVAGAALFDRSLSRVLAHGPSGDGRSVIVLHPDAAAAGLSGASIERFHASLLDRLRTTPGVEAAALAWEPPLSNQGGWRTRSVGIDGAPPIRGETPLYYNQVSPGYFSAVGLALRRGRDLSDRDTISAPFVAVINDTLGRQFFPGQDPLRRRISIGLVDALQNLEIVGIVEDAKYQTLQEPALAIAYVPVAQHAILRSERNRNLAAIVRTAAPTSLRLAVSDIDARVPVRIETLADRVHQITLNERLLAALASGLGLVALALAAASLYGLLAYTVSRHASEIGLRLALGARPTIVRWMVQREALTLAGIGIAAGLAVTVALGRFARTLLFEVTPTDPLALGGAAAVMLFVAAGAAFLPARRASLVDPIVALKRDS